ncbi:MAG TPA: riboflavin kinase [Bacteroidales bacterium]|nr:riboflavin kinase [Bacteroidales bacterium]
MIKTGREELMANLMELVERGLVFKAGRLQGCAVYVKGVVVEGNRIGRTMGYPTANLKLFAGLIVPAQGVYAAFVRLDGRWIESMVNIGIRPTLDLHNVTVEAHLFEFDEDIYGQTIEIHFIDRIRDEMRFPTLDSLKKQLHADRYKSIAILKNLDRKPTTQDRFVYFKEQLQIDDDKANG